MKTKTIIILTIIITALVIGTGLVLYNYELERNQSAYDRGYIQGTLYTQETGNIIFNLNGNLTSLRMPDEWKLEIQQYLNSQKQEA